MTNAPFHQDALRKGRIVSLCSYVRPSKTRSSVNASRPGAVTISPRLSPSTSATATRTPFWYVGYGENASCHDPHGADPYAGPPKRSNPRTSGHPAS